MGLEAFHEGESGVLNWNSTTRPSRKALLSRSSHMKEGYDPVNSASEGGWTPITDQRMTAFRGHGPSGPVAQR